MKKHDDNEGLIDICSVSIDRNLSKPERIAEYVRQIKNPYHFKCGKFTVKAKYSNDGVSLEDCLQMLMT